MRPWQKIEVQSAGLPNPSQLILIRLLITAFCLNMFFKMGQAELWLSKANLQGPGNVWEYGGNLFLRSQGISQDILLWLEISAVVIERLGLAR